MAPGFPSAGSERGWLAGLGRMARTTAFKLSAFYLLIFALFSGIILGYIAWNTRRLLDAQITETIETEISALAEQYRQGGLRRLVAIIERRGRQSGSFLYLLVDARGDAMTGNAILRVPAQSVSPGWSELRYNWPDEAEEVARRAKVRTFILPSGLRLFVGRDLEEQDRLRVTIRRARGLSLLLVVLMGGFGAWFVTRRVLSRVEGVATTSAAIMAGNLAERLPVTNTNDEFDRLALHLNAMLDRIGELMNGLRDLSDNVAHDLRTPLTRLRNGAEDALRKAETLEEAKAALERAIEESDNLLRIFDALQMIARAESGNLATSLKPLNLEEVVASLAELYEPLVEEAGLAFETTIETGLVAKANRELIGQAISNLIDNALKYGLNPEGGGSLAISAEKSGGQIRIAVADRGEGIPEDKRQAVVERFVRLDASRAKPGLGLGLSLVAAIARLHGGELRLEDSAPGLRAVLVLPEAGGGRRKEPCIRPRPARKRGMTVPTSLLSRLVSAPKSGKPGTSRLADVLAEEEARPLAALLDGQEMAKSLLAGISEGSPFLWRLVRRDPAAVADLLAASPEAGLETIFEGMRAAGRVGDLQAGMKALRQARNRHALLVAMADLGGVFDIVAVTRALSDLADEATRAALRIAIAQHGNDLAIPDREMPFEGLGLFVLALGKHGARELNYSSDIDLGCFYDPQAPALRDHADHLDRCVAIIKAMASILSQRTADGYVLRVDLRLRPDPGTTPIAMPVNAALAYYETVGQNWERAAMIKARVVAGDEAAGSAYLQELQPFIWRKYFDYSAIADIHAMKRQIYAVKGHDQIAIAGHDLKLGRGGIREIEFFVQTQQLVYGGRRPSLRGSRTLDMLDALCRETWITPEAAKDLSEAYGILRTLEHRVQMINDEQTQKLPRTEEDLASFARFCGMTRAQFDKHLTRALRRVEHHYARLFEGGPALASGAGSLVFTGVETDPETRETLKRLGFKQPERVAETVRGWHFGRRPAVTTPRAREVLTELVPGLLESFGRASDPDGAILALDGALQRMPAAVELFTILNSNASLRQLFAECLGTAPRLSQMVAQSPHVLDVLIDPDFANLGADPETRLGPRLDRETDYEMALERARHFLRGERFLIGTRALSRLIPVGDLGEAHTVLAEAILRLVFTRVCREFAVRHGEIPAGQVAIIGYGKAGSRELTANSDLDLVVVYEAPGDAWSDGDKPLMTSEYYAKLTQRLVAALSAPMRAGTLYEVDLRLRPSGKKGPVAASLSAFQEYFASEESDLWEHLALSRARVLTGDAGLSRALTDSIRALVALKRDEVRVKRETAAMRALMHTEKPGRDRFDVKDRPGGLVDLEFITQAFALLHAAEHPALAEGNTRSRLALAGEVGLLTAEETETLLAAWDVQIGFQQVARLVLPGAFAENDTSITLRRQIARLLDYPDFPPLSADVDRLQQEARAIFARRIGPVK